jgi:hypothetical protein
MDYDKCIEAALNAESRGKLDEAQMWATLAVAAVVDRAATEIKNLREEWVHAQGD